MVPCLANHLEAGVGNKPRVTGTVARANEPSLAPQMTHVGALTRWSQNFNRGL